METWDGRGLVSADWLQSHLGDRDLRLFDVTVHLRPATPGPYRIESGRADYEAAHIPGAAFLDLAADLSDTSSALNFTHLPADLVTTKELSMPESHGPTHYPQPPPRAA